MRITFRHHDRREKISAKKDVHIGLVMYIFLFLFAPPILPNINFGIIIATLSIPYIIQNWNFSYNIIKDAKMLFLVKGELVYMIHMLLMAIFYYLLGEGTNFNNYLINVYQVFLVVVVTLVGVIVILICVKGYEMDFDDIIIHFIYAGIFQAIIAITAFLFPEIKAYFVEIMLQNTGDEVLTSSFIVNQRFFGFANSMLDSFGVGTGILASLPLFLTVEYRKKYSVFIPILLVVPMLNSRTGLVIFALGCLCSFVKKQYSRKELFGFIVFIPIMIAVVMILLSILNRYYPQTYSWIKNDFLSFVGIGKNQYSTSTVLFSEAFWTFPDFIDILFGTGHTVYLAEGFKHSDVGYVNKIWNVGIFGTVFLYGIYISLFRTAIKNISLLNEKTLILFFVVSFFIFEIKGNMLTYTPGLTIILTFTFFLIWKGKKYARSGFSSSTYL